MNGPKQTTYGEDVTAMTTSLDQLERRLGVEWPHLRKARALAQSKRLELRQALAHLDSEDTRVA